METILEQEVKYTGKKIKVILVKVQLDSGDVVEREIVDKGADSVAMVPVDEHGNVYLVREYFFATNERALCLPKGKIKKNEKQEDAVIRELQEEIGMTGFPQKLIELSVSPGYLTQKTTVYLVTDLHEASVQKPELHFLEVVKLPFVEVLRKITEGEITEARTIAAIFLAKSYLNI